MIAIQEIQFKTRCPRCQKKVFYIFQETFDASTGKMLSFSCKLWDLKKAKIKGFSRLWIIHNCKTGNH